MRLRTLAANSNNSAAISEAGDIYVWGSRRFGLIADEKGNSLSKYQPTPQILDLCPPKQERATKDLHFRRGRDEDSEGDIIDNSGEEESGNEGSDDELDLTEYSARTVSMGKYHAMAVLKERDLL